MKIISTKKYRDMLDYQSKLRENNAMLRGELDELKISLEELRNNFEESKKRLKAIQEKAKNYKKLIKSSDIEKVETNKKVNVRAGKQKPKKAL